MTHRILLIDDDAPAVVASLFKPVEKNDKYTFTTRVQVNDVPWDMVDRADIIFLGYSFTDNHLGVEFLRELRKIKPGLRIPVVLLSAPNDIRNSEWQECLELGVNDFICKTTPPEIVKRKLDFILEGESYRKLSEDLKEKLFLEESRSSIESLDFKAISALVPDADEWAYTFRIILKEGPLHRRQANGFFLAVLNQFLVHLARQNNRIIQPYPFDTLNGQLQESSPPLKNPGRRSGNFSSMNADRMMDTGRTMPLGIPSRLITEIFENDRIKISDFTKNLLTGPPHDVFMNLMLLHVFEAFRDIIGPEIHEEKG